MDVGLYVHVPFCASKCGYCDFYSVVPEEGQAVALVEALLRELDQRLADEAMRVETLFVGGGTPTVLPSADLRRLFDRLGEIAERDAVVEFTVEANPASLTAENAAVLREAGVTRISLGAQSFHAGELASLDRIHAPRDIAESVRVVRDAGFDHLNLDLMFGIPGQTPESWRASLRRAVDLGADHLACYGLTYEPGTPLHARREAGLVQPADEERERDLYLHMLDALEAADFEPYELSNFARARGRCRHNLRYWRNQPGVGVGPSAASYLHGRRWRNVPDAADYVRRIGAGEAVACDAETLAPLARAGETAMLRLRTSEGIPACEFRLETGCDLFELFADPIAIHASAGRLYVDTERVTLTRQGRLLANAVLMDFLAPEPPPARAAASPG